MILICHTVTFITMAPKWELVVKIIGVAHQWLNESFIYFIRDAYDKEQGYTARSFLHILCLHAVSSSSRNVKVRFLVGFFFFFEKTFESYMIILSLIMFPSYKSRSLYVNGNVNNVDERLSLHEHSFWSCELNRLHWCFHVVCTWAVVSVWAVTVHLPFFVYSFYVHFFSKRLRCEIVCHGVQHCIKAGYHEAILVGF